MIVYLARNKLNGMCYVGQTTRPILVRVKDHVRHARRTDRRKSIFHKALSKNGAQGFTWEILGRAGDRDRLDRLEQEWIAELGTVYPGGYNLESGGNRNKRHSERSKALIADAATGVVFSDERRAKISKAKRGQKLPPRTPEHLMALSAAKLGKKLGPQTESHKEACRVSRPKAEKAPNAKLSNFQVSEIHRLTAEGVTTRELVLIFSVNKSTINRIKRGVARVSG